MFFMPVCRLTVIRKDRLFKIIIIPFVLCFPLFLRGPLISLVDNSVAIDDCAILIPGKEISIKSISNNNIIIYDNKGNKKKTLTFKVEGDGLYIPEGDTTFLCDYKKRNGMGIMTNSADNLVVSGNMIKGNLYYLKYNLARVDDNYSQISLFIEEAGEIQVSQSYSARRANILAKLRTLMPWVFLIIFVIAVVAQIVRTCRKGGKVGKEKPVSDSSIAPNSFEQYLNNYSLARMVQEATERGKMYLENRDYYNAIKELNSAIKLQPNSLAYALRGESYRMVGQINEAFTDISEAIRLDPNSPSPYGSRGIIYHQLGRYVEAITDFSEAIRLSPNYAWAYACRGGTYLQIGQKNEAFRDFCEAIRFDPNCLTAYVNRGALYAQAGQRDFAITDLEMALRLDPNDANVKQMLLALRGY